MRSAYETFLNMLGIKINILKEAVLHYKKSINDNLISGTVAKIHLIFVQISGKNREKSRSISNTEKVGEKLK